MGSLPHTHTHTHTHRLQLLRQMTDNPVTGSQAALGMINTPIPSGKRVIHLPSPTSRGLFIMHPEPSLCSSTGNGLHRNHTVRKLSSKWFRSYLTPRVVLDMQSGASPVSECTTGCGYACLVITVWMRYLPFCIFFLGWAILSTPTHPNQLLYQSDRQVYTWSLHTGHRNCDG